MGASVNRSLSSSKAPQASSDSNAQESGLLVLVMTTSGRATSASTLTNRRSKLQIPKTLLRSSSNRGRDASLSTQMLFSWTLSCPRSTAWPRCPTSFWNRWHFWAIRETPAFPRAPKTSRRWYKCSSAVCQGTMMSSRYARQLFQLSRRRITSVARWKVSGAFDNPKGRRL